MGPQRGSVSELPACDICAAHSAMRNSSEPDWELEKWLSSETQLLDYIEHHVHKPLQRHVDQNTALERELEEKRAIAVDLQSRLEESQRELAQLKDGQASMTKGKNSLAWQGNEEQLMDFIEHEVKTRVKCTHERHAALEREIERLRSSLAAAQSKNEVKERNLDHHIEELSKRESEKLHMAKSEMQLQRQLIEMESRIRDKQALADTYQASAKSLGEELERSQAAVQSAEGDSRERGLQINNLRTKAERLQTRLTQVETREEELATKLRAEVEKGEGLSKRVAELQQTLGSHENDMGALRETNQRLLEEEQELRASAERLQLLIMQEKESAAIQVNEANSRVQEKEAKNVELQHELAVVNAKHAHLDRSHSVAKEEATKLQEDFAAAEQRAEQIQREFEEVQKRAQDHHLSKVELEQALERLEGEAQLLRQKLEQVRPQFEENERLREQNEQLLKQHTDLAEGSRQAREVLTRIHMLSAERHRQDLLDAVSDAMPFVKIPAYSFGRDTEYVTRPNETLPEVVEKACGILRAVGEATAKIASESEANRSLRSTIYEQKGTIQRLDRARQASQEREQKLRTQLESVAHRIGETMLVAPVSPLGAITPSPDVDLGEPQFLAEVNEAEAAGSDRPSQNEAEEITGAPSLDQKKTGWMMSTRWKSPVHKKKGGV